MVRRVKEKTESWKGGILLLKKVKMEKRRRNQKRVGANLAQANLEKIKTTKMKVMKLMQMVNLKLKKIKGKVPLMLLQFREQRMKKETN